MDGIWSGHKHITDPAELKAECRYCGYCGSKMREVLHPSPLFDRATGKQSKAGTMFWECPKRGVGLDSMRGEWMNTHDDNPHDSTVLREA